MALKKAVIAFDEEHFSVYGGDKLLLSVPSAVVRKKSASPVAVAFGKDALLLRDSLPEGTAFFRPFRGNSIIDVPSAKLMIKYYFKKLFGFTYGVELYILISTGISPVGRAKLEQVFISCGYKHIYIIERPYLLAKIAEQKDFNVVVDFEERSVEVALCENGKVLQSHAVDIGAKNISDAITAEICEKYELSPCIKPATRSGERSFVLNTYSEVPVNTCFSLSKLSYTPVTIIGQDVISGENKSITLQARNLHDIVRFPYDKAIELTMAMLFSCDEKQSRAILEKGILFLGSATKINCFTEYMFGKCNLPVHTDDDPFLQIRTLYKLLGDDVFMSDCLGFHS